MPASAAGRLAGEIVAAIKAEIVETGRFSLPDFGSFTLRETPRRTALNPRTGEKVDVKPNFDSGFGKAVSDQQLMRPRLAFSVTGDELRLRRGQPATVSRM